MTILRLKSAVVALALAAAAPAYANLILVPGNQVPGTGLGAVSTLVTAQDNGTEVTDNGTESACVSYAGDIANPSFACQNGLQGGDNQAINQLFSGSDISGLSSAGNLAVVVNVSEGRPGNTATLTDLYLSLYNTASGQQRNYAYVGADVVMADSGGIGQSGSYLFILDALQAADANGFCPVLSECIIGGGMQFGEGTTEAPLETMYVGAIARPPVDVPEPLSLALIGAGLAGMRLARRPRA